MSNNIIDFNDLKKNSALPDADFPDLPSFNEAKNIAADRIFRSVIILQLTAFAMEAAKRAGLDQNKFHINDDSVIRFYDSDDLEEDNDTFNGIWFDWEDGDTQYRIATSVEADPEEQTVQTNVALMRLNPDDEDWEIFDGEKWNTEGPPADYFEWLLDDEDDEEDWYEGDEDDDGFYVGDGWDDDEEIDPEDEDSLWAVGIPSRSITALEKAGIGTVADLIKLSMREAREIKGIGDKSLAEIVFMLKNDGFEMRP